MRRFVLIFVLAVVAAACGGEQISAQIAEGAIGGNADVGSVFAAITYPGDRYDEIVAFYDSWTEGTGDEWQNQNATIDFDGQTQRSSAWSSADSLLFIAVADCATSGGDFDSVCVTINQS